MSRHGVLCGLFLLCLVCSVPAAATDPIAYAVIHSDARIRTAPPEVAATSKRVPYGAIVVVVDEKSVSGKDYVKVRLRDKPKTEFGWIAKSGLGSTKEFDPAMRPEDSVDDQKLTGTKALMAAIYNARGKYLKEQADALGVSPAALAAVLKVESGGRAFSPDGRVIVRFENHVFGNSWGKENKEVFDSHFKFEAKERWKGHQWRKAPSGSWVACHTSQAVEWEVLNFAKTLDEGAALASASYGIGQIMGFNHKSVGYASAREMVKKFDEGIKPQLDAMIAFIKGKEKCLRGLRAKDYTLFAECYNGTGKATEYGTRIKEAADAFAEVTAGKKYAEELPPEKVATALPTLTRDNASCFATHDRLHRRVSFQERAIDADGGARNQLLRLRDGDHEAKHLVEDSLGQPLACVAEGGMVGRGLVEGHAQEATQRQAVGTTPGNAALRIDPLEVADQKHAEVDAGWQTGRPRGSAGRW